MKILLLLTLLLTPFTVQATFTLDEPLADPAEEVRAQELFKAMRCVVCTSQALSESNADLARDIRHLTREQIQHGKSDAEIITYLTTRYGEEILLKPPLAPSTYLLWLLPFLILITGLAFTLALTRMRK